MDKRNLSFSLVVSAIFVLLFCQNVCPYTLAGGGDSVIFQQMGQAMLLGKVPYLDLFDHKGFLLYCIQAVALMLHNGHWGFFILSVINLSMTLYIWNKTTGLFIENWKKYIPSILVLGIYMPICGKGNDTEFWSLPFISYPIFLLCSHYKSGALLKYSQCFIIGLGVGVITCIRVNNAAPICMVFLAFLCSYCRQKEYKNLFYSILSVMAGFVMVLGFTILLYLGLYGIDNLYYLIYGTFIFNIEYMALVGNGSILQMPFFLSVLVCTLIVFLSRKKYLVIFLISSFIFTYLTMGKGYFFHYFTITLPLFIVGLTLILDNQEVRLININKYLIVGIFVIFVFGCFIAWPYVYPRIQRGVIMENGLHAVRGELVNIPKYERDSIWNYNTGMTGANVLQSVNCVQMNRIFLDFQLKVSEDLKEVGTIQECCPRWIMISHGTTWDDNTKCDSVFIANNYMESFRTDFETDYIKDVIFYKRR